MASSYRPWLAAFWSVAIPGLGQLYNRQIIKGIFFIILEVLINNYSNLNLAVYYSWLFDIEKAQKVINYHWLLFYPCLYVYSIFDAYCDCCKLSNKQVSKWMGIPYILTYMFGTIAVIFGSGNLPIGGLEKLGPIFLPVLVLIIGGIGCGLIYYFDTYRKTYR